MFKGIHNINLDAKGRLTIPTKYRNTISDQSNGNMVVTIDSEEKCLLLYPATVFSNIEKKINDLPSFTKNHRRIQRLIIGHAEDLELDSSGRILLSKPLRIVAEMSKKITLIGQGDKFEIWSDDIWSNRVNKWRSEETDESSESVLSDIRI
ncbi:MAG: division/cell wall cluster transcriptional repressor MraZ [Gammaproteobacteria bacterium]|nr:division/cell wall cluster transcriptional repressor MraZ [Gammaproteobacteria bacterium]MBT5643941.1 division/cell wall cluster transcriptional repressor MraZ [Gammaproteobacteria bacterium]MBT5863530.1 division/cell wall cluster transcriptional repressor MraZ [Gammaproteobacteria bacterium]MBT6734613.1 division/cell wall cluster transcriptional repressor MraZ [Gammaproteobacteria bacterium]|tara:strand:+ start:239 stop:691 length:453 start_codon:yes stop_codon:yes gene_type:complete